MTDIYLLLPFFKFRFPINPQSLGIKVLRSRRKAPLKSSKTLTSVASFVVVDSTLNGKKWHFKGGL